MPKSFRQVLPKSLALCTLLGLIAAALFTFFQPKVYEASTILQVRPSTPSFEISPELRSSDGLSPAFFPTEFDLLKSQKTLDIVIDELDLLKHWHFDRDIVRQKLSENIHTKNIRGTDLIEIRVHATSPEDAQAITEKLTAAYTERRTELESQRTEQAIAELRDAVQKQEAVVEDKRKTLTTIIRSQELIYRYGGATNPAAEAYAELQEQKIMLESQIETLLKYDGDQLMTYAAGLQLPENIIRVLHPQYLQAKRNLDALKLGGLGVDHPNVKQQKEIVDGMRRDLDEGVIALRETLRAQLELATEQIVRLKENAEMDRGIMLLGPTRKERLANMSFDDAKAEFDTAQRLLEQLKIKLIAEEMQMCITESPIIIHAPPTLPTKPIYPHLLRNLSIGLLSGLTLGFITPFLIKP